MAYVFVVSVCAKLDSKALIAAAKMTLGLNPIAARTIVVGLMLHGLLDNTVFV
jgi:hypothetical protein